MRQHENTTTTDDIANVDEPRANLDERTETDPIDSDRTDADRVESERADADPTDSNRVTTVDETARPADTTLAGQREPGRDTALTGHRGPGQDTAIVGQREPGHDTPATGQRESGHAAADVLFDEADAARFRGRWREVQAGFVDDPKRAVQDADVLVAELMQSLASAFSERKHLLEDQWREGTSAETEDLRLALRGYRSFLDQLLAH
jgi:hypothetical protein